MGMNIVLFQPEEPPNTGNIARTCVATASTLHLIDPLGFKLTDRYLKRAAMDYWKELSYKRYDDWDDFMTKNPDAPLYFATTKGQNKYTDMSFEDEAYLVFGPESRGLPEELLIQYPSRCMRIPMIGETRSLNLSNSVAIVLYEALRQHGFSGMKDAGELHRLSW